MSQQSTSIVELVQGFAKHIKALRSPETKEATVRQNYIDPFWRALEWDVGDTKQLGPSVAEVIIEKNVETAESTGFRNRRPDYLFRLAGFPRFIVEAKKPTIDIDTDKEAIFQAKQYAWNSTIPFAILTNFQQFRLYDTTLKPIFQEPRRGLVKEFSLNHDNYVAQWDVLTETFGRAAVEGGSLERLLAQVKKIKAGRRIRTVDRMLIDLKGGEPVDQVFLDYLDTHRRHFAADVYRHNKSAFPEADTHHGAAKLTEAVQRIMDRLVFMRVCEDRDIIPFRSLRKTLDRVGAEGGEFYDSLTATFREMDAKYNGYLYKPHFSEALKVDGGVLADFTRTLYPPDGPWDFAAIGDDILGIVYERFLGNVVTVKKGQATIEEKPEVRHAGGVHYTPRFVVDTIIRRVVGPKIQGKTPAEVLDVKILDPACGSGSFLVAALQYLFDYCLAAIYANPSLAKAIVPALSAGTGAKGRKKKSEIAFQDKEGRWHLAPDFRAALLTHCIHGVDIDQQAVEVTVMSLYLKMLESKLPENWATLWVERQLLPPLDNNIQCGNSLIAEADWFAYAETTKATLFSEDKDIAFRINRFDWESRTRGFGRLLDSQAVKERGRTGFDCIIGNPPYIRVQELNKWAPEECEFYKWKYKSAAKGNYDVYVVFAEKCLSLLSPDGLLGFIMPHKFWQAKYGEGLRKVIADGKHLRALVDFGDQQVFKGATTYTAVHVLSRAANATGVDYAKIVELEDAVAQCAILDSGGVPPRVIKTLAIRPTSGAPWSFKSSDADKWCKTVADTQATLGDIAEVFVGVQTSADDVYHLDLLKWGRNRCTVRSRTDERTWGIERAVLHPLVSGQDTRAYGFENLRQVILYPYEWSGTGRSKLHGVDHLQEVAPNAWEYLKCHEKALRAREAGRFDNDEWYQFGRSQNLGRQKGIKLCVPRLADRLRCAFDDPGEFCLDNVDVNGVRLRPTAKSTDSLAVYLLLCGIINSLLAETYIRTTVSTHFRGGFASYNRQFIEALPIKLPTTGEDKKLAKRITESVRVIMDAKAKLRAPAAPFSAVKDGLKSAGLSDRETKSLEAEVEAHERRIDEAVFALYGVEGLPE